ncbi:MAG: hypothetical protein J1E62_02500 [Lachnospiraceae bacterium]|nr:hypothetical protein [Lachnospiraceae bacterium]
MNVHVSYFDELEKQEWNYPSYEDGAKETQLILCPPDADVSGGKIQIRDIDKLANYPEVKSVTILGLRQDTFEYFIQTYGKQLRYIKFFKNKAVEDWSLLGTLPELECVYWFHNQRITKLWDMSQNHALRAVELNDFTRLHDLSGVEKAPALEWFGFGDAVCYTSELESLKPFINTKIKRIDFYGNKIRDMDISFIPDMPNLEVFNFPSNHYTTEQVAWLVAKCPNLKGRFLKSHTEHMRWNDQTNEPDIPGVIIVGKRKPMLAIEGNEKKIANYIAKFEKLVEQYRKE